MGQKKLMLVSLLQYNLFFLLYSSPLSLIIQFRCPDEFLPSGPQWVHWLCHHHRHITKRFMFFSSLTCSVAFPWQACPASSMIEVIKKVDIIWKLISFDYAKELSKNIYGGTWCRWMWICMLMVWLGWWQTGGELENYVILGWDGCGDVVSEWFLQC